MVLKIVPERENDLVERAQQLRLRRFGMSVATYLVAVLATFLITHLGIGVLSTIQWVILIGWCLFGISIFFALFYTNVNLRFAEPSLTREQIVFSSFYGIMAMYWLPEARPIIFLFVLAPFSFGMLILTFRQFLVVAACLMGLYIGLLTVDYLNHRQEFNIQYQLFLFVLFGLILSWFSFFGGFVSTLRRSLRVIAVKLRTKLLMFGVYLARKDLWGL
jgi:diguanylate cyclase